MLKIVTIENFDKEFKKLVKKYPSIITDLRTLLNSLQDNPLQGSPLGKDCYKVRMAIGSKNKGKSGGARIITCVKITQETITLVSIYDKSQQSDIENNLLIKLLETNNLL